MAGSKQRHHTADVRRGHNQGSARAGRRRWGHTAQRGTGYNADGQHGGDRQRAHARHEGTIRGNRLGAQNVHGAKREGAQYAARGRGTRGQVWGSKWRTTGWALRPGGIFAAAAGGGRRALRQESPRTTSKLEMEIVTTRSIATPATGFASCKFGHCQKEYQIFLRMNFRTPEGQQQLLWKGLLRLEVQQGIATVYSTYGSGLAEGEGLATSRERRAAKRSWVASGLAVGAQIGRSAMWRERSREVTIPAPKRDPSGTLHKVPLEMYMSALALPKLALEFRPSSGSPQGAPPELRKGPLRDHIRAADVSQLFNFIDLRLWGNVGGPVHHLIHWGRHLPSNQAHQFGLRKTTNCLVITHFAEYTLNQVEPGLNISSELNK
ncbi:hypothetical protein B0H14DRAFT_2615117 [Mycena olivaceomarginata]|nr:hypothetical protein B0H14DRAFT_2615117 [Mycena olivaceomarginata]